MKYLVIATTKKQVEIAKNRVKKFMKDGNEVVILPFGIEAQDKLEDEKLPYKEVRDYFTKDIGDEVLNDAFSIATEWYKAENNEKNRDLSIYNNISLGSISEADMAVVISAMLKDLKIIRMVINVENPNKVLIADDADYRIKTVLAILSMLKIPVDILPTSFLPSNFYNNYMRRCLVRYVKPHVSGYFFRWTGYPRSYWKRINRDKSRPPERGKGNDFRRGKERLNRGGAA